MFQLPEYYHNLSLRLSGVLDDIGVNERMVKKRRRSALQRETSISLVHGSSFNIFGSNSEGTTTFGLRSDVDILASCPYLNVIQNYAEWKPGLTNLLMIQDDVTSPGYCHLQILRHDEPLPVLEIINEHCVRDAHDRILLKNTAFDNMYKRGFKNGPAMTEEARLGTLPTDTVCAVSCESWPVEARDWSKRSLGIWPTEDMKRYAENSGCFVVPVGSKLSQIEYLEWRISTSRAERCLMFNLNITQIQCFVLLKMILKTHLQHPVSSYMCKTVLLHCIEKTNYNMWQVNNLLRCLTVCLQVLYCSILHKRCPHYFIPGNNLMARQFSPRIKDKLMKSLHHILESKGTALYEIQIDDLGERLEIKMNPLYQSVKIQHLTSANDISLQISGSVILYLAREITAWHHPFLLNKNSHLSSPLACSEDPLACSEELVRLISNSLRLYKEPSKIERKSLQLLVPFYCSSLGSVLASINLRTIHSVTPEALNWLLAGMNSDVSSGRLKLASVLYCAGDMLRAESILRETEGLYRLDTVEFVCTCYDFAKRNFKMEFCRVCHIQNEKALNRVCAVCVKFLRAEMSCIPHELQYELFRSTEEELLHRDDYDSCWMEMAVVDSLPFLFFLQYKTYGNLQSYINQQRALANLAFRVNSEEHFGHRETAFNLLGQCYEQENRLNDALVCYTTSLNIRGTNNVARYHLCRLLAYIQHKI